MAADVGLFAHIHLFFSASPNRFVEPNRHVLTFLHPILISRVTCRAPLERLLVSLYMRSKKSTGNNPRKLWPIIGEVPM
jgi:hypothetical protein